MQIFTNRSNFRNEVKKEAKELILEGYGLRRGEMEDKEQHEERVRNQVGELIQTWSFIQGKKDVKVTLILFISTDVTLS